MLITFFKKSWNHKARLLCNFIILMFIGMIDMAFTPYQNFYMMAGMAFNLCFALPLFSTMTGTIMHTTIPSQKMGRISAILSMLIGIVMSLGYLISGPIAKWIGTENLFLITGILGILTVIVIRIFTNINSLEFIEEKQISLPKSHGEKNLDFVSQENLSEAIET